MKKAYLIIAHKNPNQLHRLISRLNDGNSAFFVHIDIKVDLIQFHNLYDFGDALHFIDRFNSTWGGLGTIEPFLNGLRMIDASREKFDRVMLLSGQDYPIKSNQQIDEFFQNSPKSVFLNYFPIPNHEKWPGSDRGGIYRVDKYYFGQKWFQLFCSKSLNFLSGFIPLLKRKIPNQMRPFTGQTWWNLDSYAVKYLLNYHVNHPEYIKFHENTFVADELFVQMIIGNSTDERLLKSIENSEKRFTIWENVTNAHPKMLVTADFGRIFASDDLFARKFDDTVDAEILDLIDRKILLKASV